jgi:hypothetical protein
MNLEALHVGEDVSTSRVLGTKSGARMMLATLVPGPAGPR